MMEELKPCPFCGGQLKHVESWAKSFQPKRLYHEYHHLSEGCVLSKSSPMASFDDRSEDRRLTFLNAWNTRQSDTLIANPMAWLDEPKAVEAIAEAICPHVKPWMDSSSVCLHPCRGCKDSMYRGEKSTPACKLVMREIARTGTATIKRIAKEGMND